jgi:hypothetical protein
MATSAAERVYGVLVDDDEDHGCGALPESACRDVPGSALTLVGALTLQKVGDRIVDPKTVLAWLFAALAAPTALTGLLVPVRESGSLLPQAALVPVVRRFAQRKWVWVIGAAGMALAVGVMALLAASTTGTVAGLGILVALAVFALSRSLSSISSKDVLGRTVPKGERGQVTGVSSITSGLVAITVGLAIRMWGGQQTGPVFFALLLGGAALLWIGAGAVFATVREPPGERDESLDAGSIVAALALLGEDAIFRRFVTARTLLLVSALAPPFIVTLATARGDVRLSGLGPFIIAQGVASLIGGRIWGRVADRSSRRVIILAAGLASITILCFLAIIAVDRVGAWALTYPLAYFALALIHTGSRIGRKTYVVDLAGGDERTNYVAVSNTAMGVLLLVAGAVSAGLASLGATWALGFLAALGLLGVPVARGLPEVGAPAG